MELEEVSRWAFIVFVLVAIVSGIILGYSAYASYETLPTDAPMWWASNVRTNDGYVLLVMLIFGVIVGLISITAKEVTPFLIAAIALIVGTGFNVWAGLWYIHPLLFFLASAILSYIAAFAAPAAVIIAIKAVFAMAKEK